MYRTLTTAFAILLTATAFSAPTLADDWDTSPELWTTTSGSSGAEAWDEKAAGAFVGNAETTLGSIHITGDVTTLSGVDSTLGGYGLAEGLGSSMTTIKKGQSKLTGYSSNYAESSALSQNGGLSGSQTEANSSGPGFKSGVTTTSLTMTFGSGSTAVSNGSGSSGVDLGGDEDNGKG